MCKAFRQSPSRHTASENSLNRGLSKIINPEQFAVIFLEQEARDLIPSYTVSLCPGRGGQKRVWESTAPGFGGARGQGVGKKMLKVTLEELALEW